MSGGTKIEVGPLAFERIGKRQGEGVLLPEQDVEGSNPFTRSIRRNRGSCLSRNSLITQLERYELHAHARGFSSSTIAHVKRCLIFFANFVGGIDDTTSITGDDLRRFIVALKGKRADSNQQQTD